MDNQSLAYGLMMEIDRICKDHLSGGFDNDHEDYYRGQIQAYRNVIKTIIPHVDDFGVGINLLNA